MPSPTTCRVALWLLWLASWILAARWSAPTRRTQRPGARVLQMLLISIGSILLVRRVVGAGPLVHRLLPEMPQIAWGPVVLTAAGLGWAWWARIHLGRMWSSNVTLKDNHAIIRTGPYGITRHPIYTGLLVALAASAWAQNSVLSGIGLILIVVGFVFKLREEERLLIEHFGSAYSTYRTEVRALVPGVW